MTKAGRRLTKERALAYWVRSLRLDAASAAVRSAVHVRAAEMCRAKGLSVAAKALVRRHVLARSMSRRLAGRAAAMERGDLSGIFMPPRWRRGGP